MQSRESVPENLLTFYGIQCRGVKNEQKDFYSQSTDRGVNAAHKKGLLGFTHFNDGGGKKCKKAFECRENVPEKLPTFYVT